MVSLACWFGYGWYGLVDALRMVLLDMIGFSYDSYVDIFLCGYFWDQPVLLFNEQLQRPRSAKLTSFTMKQGVKSRSLGLIDSSLHVWCLMLFDVVWCLMLDVWCLVLPWFSNCFRLKLHAARFCMRNVSARSSWRRLAEAEGLKIAEEAGGYFDMFRLGVYLMQLHGLLYLHWSART